MPTDTVARLVRAISRALAGHHPLLKTLHLLLRIPEVSVMTMARPRVLGGPLKRLMCRT